MAVRLFDSELKVMDVIWREGALPAKKIAQILKESVGWNPNTTYTLIKRCVAKGALERIEPNFVCRALITREQVRQQKASELLDKLFNGSAVQLFCSLLDTKRLSEEEIERLKRIIDNLK